MKNQKGITLIALIITIIVMLILVTVSVTVALQTNLFSTAQGGAKNTLEKRDEEISASEGWITIIENGVEKRVNINSYFGSYYGNNGMLTVSSNPTHILVIESFNCLIDRETTVSDLADSFPERFEVQEIDSGYGGTCLNFYFIRDNGTKDQIVYENGETILFGHEVLVGNSLYLQSGLTIESLAI